jgi:DNA polymerase elongation subunit (family B)
MNYFKTSLAKLGEAMGFEKKETPYGNPDIQIWKEYCKRDVEILKKAVLSLIEFQRVNDLGTFAPTISGMAMNAFRHRFMTNEIFVHNDDDITEFERLSYRGGRTEAFFIGDVEDSDLTVVDINSFYPYIMLNKTLPTKLVKIRRRTSIEQLKELLTKYSVIADVLYELKEPAIAHRTDKIIFPVGIMNDVLTTPELQLLLNEGLIKEIGLTMVYENAQIFEAFINYFYNERMNARARGDKTMDYYFKIYMNSLYGKFAQKNPYWKTIKESEESDNTSFFDYDSDTGKRTYIRIVGGQVQQNAGFRNPYDVLVAISSEVTGYARTYLWQLIETAGINNVYYIDTDSLFVTPAGLHRLSAFIDATKLGYLKIEPKKIYEIRGAKHYRSSEGWVCKGIKKDAHRLEDGSYQQTSITKAPSALRAGELDMVRTKLVVKHLTNVYDKGVVQPDGRVLPHHLDQATLRYSDVNWWQPNWEKEIPAEYKIFKNTNTRKVQSYE